MKKPLMRNRNPEGQINQLQNNTERQGKSNMEKISDRVLDEYYAKDYFGSGTNYFEPPEDEEEDDESELI